METVNIMELAYNLIKRVEQQDVILIAVLVVFVLQYAWLVLVWINMNDEVKE